MLNSKALFYLSLSLSASLLLMLFAWRGGAGGEAFSGLRALAAASLPSVDPGPNPTAQALSEGGGVNVQFFSGDGVSYRSPGDGRSQLFRITNARNLPIYEFAIFTPSGQKTLRFNLNSLSLPKTGAPAFTQLNGTGVYLRVYLLGPGPDGFPVYQINVYDSAGTLYTDGFLFSN